MASGTNNSMQAYQVHLIDDTKSKEFPSLLRNLSLVSLPIPKPSPGFVVVRVRAVALNPRDIAVISGTYPFPTSDGVIPCLDAAGEVHDVGSGSKWQDKRGSRVIVNMSKDWMDGDVAALRVDNILGSSNINGTLAQFITLPDNYLSDAPQNLSYEEAATLGCAGSAAINILSSVPINRGSTVMTQGTGGVSCFVIQVRAIDLHLIMDLLVLTLV